MNWKVILQENDKSPRNSVEGKLESTQQLSSLTSTSSNIYLMVNQGQEQKQMTDEINEEFKWRPNKPIPPKLLLLN